MLLVKTYIAPSNIHGIGLFAAEPIKAGSIVWRYMEGFDRMLEPQFVASLPEIAQTHIRHFCALMKHSGKYLMTGDNDRFWNHSDEPNCLTDEAATETKALRDIQQGEELTEDYLRYCDSIDEGVAAVVVNEKKL